MICQVERHDPGKEVVLSIYRTPGEPPTALLVVSLLCLLLCLYIGVTTWGFGGFRIATTGWVALGSGVLVTGYALSRGLKRCRFSREGIKLRSSLGWTTRVPVSQLQLAAAPPPIYGEAIWAMKWGGMRGENFVVKGCHTPREIEQLALRIAAAMGLRTYQYDQATSQYNFSSGNDLPSKVPDPAGLENDRFFTPIQNVDPGLERSKKLPGGVELVEVGYDLFAFRYSQSSEKRIVAWIGVPVLLLLLAVMGGLIHRWEAVDSASRGVALAAIMVSGYIPWLCWRLYSQFLPHVEVCLDGAARVVREVSYLPQPEEFKFDDIRAVFLKRTGNRSVVSLDLATRRNPVLTLSSDVDEDTARTTSRAIALEISRRLGVPTYEA